MHPQFLCPLNRGSQTESNPPPLRMALLNVLSLVNKTFILHDFFISRSLDFLFMTETWTKEGDLSPFSELVPQNCSFLNTSRSSGRGGGLAVVFKNSFYGRIIPSEVYKSFEAQMSLMDLANPVLCVVIYRPPQFNNAFLSEFADFLGNVVTMYDQILLLGDFNIHICCKPLSKDFCNLMDSFSFSQWVQCPTHIHGHILDLVFSHGFSITDMEIGDSGFSDHKFLTFTSALPRRSSTSSAPTRWVRYFSPTASDDFTTAYKAADDLSVTNWSLESFDTNTYFNLFNNTCLNIVNNIAPLKIKRSIRKSSPWFNDSIRSLRRNCRRVERKWRVDRLQVSYDIRRESLSIFKKAVKSAKF